MPQPPSPAGRRELVARLAAHIAFLLNDGAGGVVVEVKPFALFQHLIALLSGRGPLGAVYRDGLLAYRVAAADRSEEEVAQAYIDRVLDRGFMLPRADHQHIAHRLLGKLCRRGAAEGWSTTDLCRAKAGETTASGGPADFGTVADRLRRFDKTISDGNPAHSTRATHGPLLLSTGDGNAVEVPEELSTWKAILSSPSRQLVLASGAPFDELCSTMIKAVEAANAHYGALVRLGLPPLDWMDAVSTNTAKALSAFITDVRKVTGGELNDLPAWQQIWTKRKVPGYADADALWAAEVGRALRAPTIARRGWVEDVASLEDAPEAEEVAEPELMANADFGELLAEARGDEAISDFDVWLLGRVYAGDKLAELEKDQRCIAVLAEKGGTLAEYLSGLEARLRSWRREKP